MAHRFPPAPGYHYEGLNGPSNGPGMVVATWVTLALAIVAVGLRMSVKWFLLHSTASEDYFAIAALLVSIARTVMLTYGECGQRPRVGRY